MQDRLGLFFFPPNFCSKGSRTREGCLPSHLPLVRLDSHRRVGVRVHRNKERVPHVPLYRLTGQHSFKSSQVQPIQQTKAAPKTYFASHFYCVLPFSRAKRSDLNFCSGSFERCFMYPPMLVLKFGNKIVFLGCHCSARPLSLLKIKVGLVVAVVTFFSMKSFLRTRKKGHPASVSMSTVFVTVER